MAFTLKDRVKDTTTSTGTGSVTLSGTAPSGFQAFSAIGNGNVCAYTIAGGGQWETGIGTYSSSGPTLSRGTVLDSSNGGAAVNFGAGVKDVFVTVPAALIGWQEIASVTPGAVNAIDFDPIPQVYSDLRVMIEGVSHNGGSNQAIQFGIKDGSTFSTMFSVHGAGPASITYYGEFVMMNYRSDEGAIIGSVANISDTPRIQTGSGVLPGWRCVGGIKGLRVGLSGSATFDAGTIKLQARL